MKKKTVAKKTVVLTERRDAKENKAICQAKISEPEPIPERISLIRTKTVKCDDCNEVNKIYSNGNVVKSYHTDVADNIYLQDRSCIAMFHGEEVKAKNRLALCQKIAFIINKGEPFPTLKGVPELYDHAPRHSVAWLNYQGVTACNGNKVKNR
jgi:hypothetical protein